MMNVGTMEEHEIFSTEQNKWIICISKEEVLELIDEMDYTLDVSDCPTIKEKDCPKEIDREELKRRIKGA